jgi:2,5-diketo-D-gluconate reductase A
MARMNQDSTLTLRTGRQIPVMGLGTWQLTDDTAGTIEKALGLGYRMIDTSGDYGTQPGIAEGIKRSGVGRSDFYLVTKIEETDDAYEATRRNLDELQLAAADLMLIHRPPENGAGEDLWRGLIRARDEGLTRDIGVSNYPIELIEALIEATGEVPAVNQIEWSPLGHSKAMQDYADERGIIIQAYSPLTRGTGIAEPAIAEIARKHKRTPAQVMIRWNLQNGTVPLPKANRVEHLEENLGALGFSLEPEEMEVLDGLNRHYSALGSLPYN